MSNRGEECRSWAKDDPLMLAYHDHRWCRPCRDDRELFAMLCLEGQQAGLSWSTIIHKEAAIRRAFDDFDIETVAGYTDEQVEALMQNPDIIRNRAKIRSAIKNANAILKLRESGEYATFSDYIWHFTDGKQIIHQLRGFEEMPARSELSERVSRDMKKRGFSFVGPVIIYSYLQGIGVIDDHLVGCPCKASSEVPGREEDLQEDPFAEYIREQEPEKREKGYAWYTAIGLQAVDGLKTSRYLQELAIRNIEGEISTKEVEQLLTDYYENSQGQKTPDRTDEADLVSLRIREVLAENSFSFTPNEYISIHRKLFRGVYSHAGKIRDYNLSKKEWVLNGHTVIYGSASELRATLDYDFAEERKFSYRGLEIDEIIHHLALFVSRLWQIHIFGEGNTRTTAVFFIKYLRTLGFDVTNDVFAENAWYFRNAMVRANYNDLRHGVHETTEFLELFLRNLLLNEKNELHNRDMHISGLLDTRGKVDISRGEADIRSGKVDIDTEKVDIGRALDKYFSEASLKTRTHITEVYRTFGREAIFGRSDVQNCTGLRSSRASVLLKLLLEKGIIVPVSGHGKGKYRFASEFEG